MSIIDLIAIENKEQTYSMGCSTIREALNRTLHTKNAAVRITVMEDGDAYDLFLDLNNYLPQTPMKLTLCKILGTRNGITKLNAHRPTGAEIAYTTATPTEQLGSTGAFDPRDIHYQEVPGSQFGELRILFHTDLKSA